MPMFFALPDSSFAIAGWLTPRRWASACCETPADSRSATRSSSMAISATRASTRSRRPGSCRDCASSHTSRSSRFFFAAFVPTARLSFLVPIVAARLIMELDRLLIRPHPGQHVGRDVLPLLHDSVEHYDPVARPERVEQPHTVPAAQFKQPVAEALGSWLPEGLAAHSDVGEKRHGLFGQRPVERGQE